MPSAEQQRCTICGNELFPHYPDDAKKPDGWRCLLCEAEYDYNEGFMLSAGWAAEKIKYLQAIVDKLPKCNRLVDGEVVQDCPVVPGMNAWTNELPRIQSNRPFAVSVVSLHLEHDADEPPVTVRDLDGQEWALDAEELFNSLEAAEAANAKEPEA